MNFERLKYSFLNQLAVVIDATTLCLNIIVTCCMSDGQNCQSEACTCHIFRSRLIRLRNEARKPTLVVFA